jgi:hypothetical protein
MRLSRPFKPRIGEALVLLFVDCTLAFIPKAPKDCAESRKKADADRSGTGFFVSVSQYQAAIGATAGFAALRRFRKM